MHSSRLRTTVIFLLSVVLVAGACRLSGMDRDQVYRASWLIVLGALALAVGIDLLLDGVWVRRGWLAADELPRRRRLSFIALGVLLALTAAGIVYRRSAEATEREEEARRQQEEAEASRLRLQAADGAAVLETLKARRAVGSATNPATRSAQTAPSAAQSSAPPPRPATGPG